MTSTNLSSRLTVTVRLFAAYAEAVGKSDVEISLAEGSTVEDLMAEFREQVPGGSALPRRPMCAVNLRHVLPGQALRHGDVVAVLPPLAGG